LRRDGIFLISYNTTNSTIHNYYTPYTLNGLLFQDNLCKVKTSLDLNEARDERVLGWQWHQLDHMQTICTLLQTYNHTNTSSLNFYTPDALYDAQATVTAPISLLKFL